MLFFIRLYQKIFSFDTGVLRYLLSPLRIIVNPLGVCRYTPTCSEYTYQAIKKYGIITGLLLGIKRFASCHPFSPGGYYPLK